MGKMERLQMLPDWPARMTAQVAAAYMDVSQSTFLVRFGDIGKKEGGNTFWARAQLDRIIAAQFNIDAPAPAGQGGIEDPYDAWKKGGQKGK